MRQERVVFMGTPSISKIYLQSLIDHRYNIIAIYTQPPRKQGRGMQIKNSPVPVSYTHLTLPTIREV